MNVQELKNFLYFACETEARTGRCNKLLQILISSKCALDLRARKTSKIRKAFKKKRPYSFD